MATYWAVTIYNTSTGAIVDYATFNSEWEAVHYARVRVFAEEKYLGFKVKKVC